MSPLSTDLRFSVRPLPRVVAVGAPALLVLLACPKGEPCPPAPPCASAPVSAGEMMPPLKDTDVVATVKGEPMLAKEIQDKIKGPEAKAQAEYLKRVYQAREQAAR